MSPSVSIETKSGIAKIGGVDYPSVGFGTYTLKGDMCTQAVKNAVKAGYRLIDTATFYENFMAIAKALKGEDRSRFYLTSKVWPNMQSPENLHKDLSQTLEQLETDYLDAYLLHWPNSKLPLGPTLDAMKEVQKEKKIRHIGLSNVTVNHLKKVEAFKTAITWVQVEMHPNFCDFDLLKYCSEHSITIQAWRPLDLGRLKENQMLIEIGKRYNKTACQVALKWIMQHGTVALPGSKTQSHIEENIDVFDFLLSKEEMEKIDANARKGERFRLKDKKRLGFTDEFDFSYEQCWPVTEQKQSQR